MAKILFIAEVPPSDALSTAPAYSAKWRDFAKAAADSTKGVADAKRIAEGSWLIDAGGALSCVHELTSSARQQGLPFRVFLVEGDITELTKPEPRGGSSKPLRA